MRLVGDDAQQPGPERCALAKAPERAVRLDERLLGGVLGVGGRSGDHVGGAVGDVLVLLHEALVGPRVAAPRTRDPVVDDFWWAALHLDIPTRSPRGRFPLPWNPPAPRGVPPYDMLAALLMPPSRPPPPSSCPTSIRPRRSRSPCAGRRPSLRLVRLHRRQRRPRPADRRRTARRGSSRRWRHGRSCAARAAAARRLPAGSLLRYVRARGHSHWHLMGFARYELRRPDGDALARRARKQGFCLGDRYRAGAAARLRVRRRGRSSAASAGSTSLSCFTSARASRSATATTIHPPRRGRRST